LITTVVAAAVLVNAIFPVISGMSGTFSSTTHQADVQIRTDFKIITTYASSSAGTAQVWMKNIGSERISLDEIKQADVFCGPSDNFDHLAYSDTIGANKWIVTFTSPEYDLNNNNFWDIGETIKITAQPAIIPASGGEVYFQFALPSGIWRTTEFPSS